MPDEIRDINVSVLDDQSETSHTKGYKVHYNDDRILIGTQAEIDEIPLAQKNGKVVIITDEAVAEGEGSDGSDESITLTVDIATETITYADLKAWLESKLPTLLVRSKYTYIANSNGNFTIGNLSTSYGRGLTFFIHFVNSNPQYGTVNSYGTDYDAIQFAPNYIVEGRAAFTCTLNNDKSAIETATCLGVFLDCPNDGKFFRPYINCVPVFQLKKIFADMASEMNYNVYNEISGIMGGVQTIQINGRDKNFYTPVDLWTIRKFPGDTVVRNYSLTSQGYYNADSFNGIVFFSRKLKKLGGNVTEYANSVGYEIYMLILDWAQWNGDGDYSESSNIANGYGGGRLYKLNPPFIKYTNGSTQTKDVWDGSENIWCMTSWVTGGNRGLINKILYWNINPDNSNLTFDQLIQTTPSYNEEIATKSELSSLEARIAALENANNGNS